MAKAKQIDETTFAGRVALRIRTRREKMKLSVEQIAAAAGVPASTWYRWESAKGMKLEGLETAAKALGCSATKLVDR